MPAYLPNDLSIAKLSFKQWSPGSPADEANLRAGDVILSVNGEDVRTVDQLARHVSDSLGEEVTLRVLRGSVPLAVYLVPRENPPPGEGPLGVTISLINPVFERQSAPIWQAPWNGILLMGNVITSTASEFGRAASSGSNPGIAGPVGIAQATGEAARAGPVALLIIVGLLSLNLGILNLLPIPALDGGRIPVPGARSRPPRPQTLPPTRKPRPPNRLRLPALPPPIRHSRHRPPPPPPGRLHPAVVALSPHAAN